MRCQLSPVVSQLWKQQTTFFHVLLLLFFLFVLFFTSERRKKKTKLCRPLSARHYTTFYYISLSSVGYFSSCFSSTCCCDVQHISFFIPSGGYFLYLLYRDTYTCPAISFSPFHLVFSFVSLLSYILSISLSFIALMERHGGGIFIYTGVYTTANPRSGSARPKWISLQ